MEIQPDFKELLALFVECEVEFLIVGAHALAHHGAPRFTGDLDLLVRPLAGNAQKVLAALAAFGFGSVDLQESDFTESNNVVQLGHPPVRVDIITSLTGVSWEEAWFGRVPSRFGDSMVCFLGKAEFIKNKRAVGRLKDLADIEALGEV